MKNYEGNIYKLKKNSIKKTKKKYDTTYHYVLSNILRYKKYLSIYEMKEQNQEEFNSLLMNIMESTANDLNVKKDKVYNYNRFHKAILRNLHKSMKVERKSKVKSNILVLNHYSKIKEKKYKELRELSLTEENDFLKAIYLYTISED